MEKLVTDLESFKARAQEEIRTTGAIATETKSALEKISSELIATSKRLDAMEVKAAKPDAVGPHSISDELRANSALANVIGNTNWRGATSFDLSRNSASQLFERKDVTVSSLGLGTPGVVPAERMPGILGALKPQVHMRTLLVTEPTSAAEVVWVYEKTRPTKASPYAENTEISVDAALDLDIRRAPVQTIACLCRASRQVLADYPELEAFLRTEFAARVEEEVDRQILFGSGTPPDLNGLTTQAQVWDSTIVTGGSYTYVDVLAGARQQVAEANGELGMPFYIVHPGDLWKMRRTKDEYGRYVLGDPMSPFTPNLWGAPIYDTTQMTQGYFLYGNAEPRAAIIRDREPVTVEMSTEDGNNFRYKLVTFRAEVRLAVVCKQPDAFVYGAFSESPAS